MYRKPAERKSNKIKFSVATLLAHTNKAPCNARLQKEYQLRLIKRRNSIRTYPPDAMYRKTAENTSTKTN
jgi:hypothetical protein